VSRLPHEKSVESLCRDGGVYYIFQRNVDPVQTSELGAAHSSTIDLEPGKYLIAFMLRTDYGAYPLSGFPLELSVQPSRFTD